MCMSSSFPSAFEAFFIEVVNVREGETNREARYDKQTVPSLFVLLSICNAHTNSETSQGLLLSFPGSIKPNRQTCHFQSHVAL